MQPVGTADALDATPKTPAALVTVASDASVTNLLSFMALLF